MQKGLFITLEGPEGSGKSTHIRRLGRYLQAQGHAVTLTREPGGTIWAKALRHLLLHTQKHVFPLAELLLYEADRAQHMEEVVLPELQRGRVVLCDRFSDSTLAYQGYGRRLDLSAIQTLNTIASHARKPDLTFLLDVPVEQGLRQAARKKKGQDRLEKAGLAFHKRIRQGYLSLARQEPRRFRVIRQQKSIQETQRLIRQAVDQFLARR